MPPHRAARTAAILRISPTHGSIARPTEIRTFRTSRRSFARNFAPPAPPIHIGSDFATSRAFFGGFDAGWGAQDLENRLNHPTPAIQFGIVLQGTFSITTTDGETRRLRPGSVFRLEDTSPCKGHITVVGDEPGFLMFVRLMPDDERCPSPLGIIHGRGRRSRTTVHVRFAPKAERDRCAGANRREVPKSGVVAV